MAVEMSELASMLSDAVMLQWGHGHVAVEI